MQSTIAIPTRPKRKFVPENLIIDSWDKIKSLFDNLAEREISSVADLEKWMLDRSELEAVLQEDEAWRYIKMNIDTIDKELAERFHFWIKEIEPNIAPYNQKLNLKLINSVYLKELDQEKYRIYLRNLKNQIEIFREKNIPLFTIMREKEQEYGAISAKMSVEIDSEKMTMQKAALLLKDTNRNKREKTYNKISARKLQDEKVLNNLYDELIELRQEIANNSGFDNYRDYMFSAMGRFDYTPEDCFNFHNAIKQEIVPIRDLIVKKRKNKLKYKSYKPWDTSVNVDGLPPLKPFKGGKELTKLSIECLSRLRPYFGKCLSIMNTMKHLDLESKDGKAPGGFNCPLYEIGVPFIYMNAVGSQRDINTMIHEGGHAIHSFLSSDLILTNFKETPSEVAELASMSMEFFSMNHWNIYYSNSDELKRAKIEHLEGVLYFLPHCMMIDEFQHWVYTNKHTSKERKQKWDELTSRFGSSIIDWEGHEDRRANSWQEILHLFEVPFYYIEYGMAQLGAIAMWKSHKELGEEALDNYMSALKLGYTKSISEIYDTAGIKFDFSTKYVKELADFIKEELEKLY